MMTCNCNGHCDHPDGPFPWRWVAGVLAVLALLAYVTIRCEANVIARPMVPASCQLLGGTWDAWHGWRCG